MSKQWQCIYSACNSLEAHSVKGLLESKGVNARLTGEALGAAMGELPANVVEVKVWVEQWQWQRAQGIVSDYQRTDYYDWHCSQCGEVNQGQFELCWNCQCDRDQEP